MTSISLDKFFHKLPITPDNTCSYFNDRKSRLKYALLDETSIFSTTLEEFTNRGYRRSGNFLYTANCNTCRLCLPYRIPLDRLSFNESQRRNLKSNSNFIFILTSPKPTLEKESIYLKYIKSRHSENNNSVENDLDILDTMYSQMYSFTTSSWEIEIYDKKKLIGFGILDVGVNLVSAVYNVYDPSYKSKGLGVYMIAKSMEILKSENTFHYFHLGFLIPGHPKMDYKKQYKPGEILHPLTKIWQPANTIL